MAADSLFKIDQLLQIFENEIHYSSFRLNYYVKECLSSKYPLNIASLKHIKNYHFISHEQTIEILNKNEHNVAILCCGYARQFIQYDLPMDMIGMIGTLCNIECIAELRNEALMMLLSSPIDLNKIGEFIPILMKSFKKTQSIQIQSRIFLYLYYIGIKFVSFKQQCVIAHSLQQCVRHFARLSADDPNPHDIKLMINCGILPKVIQLMYGNSFNLAFLSSWLIANIAAVPSICRSVIVNCGAIDAFVFILRNNNFGGEINIITQSILGLGNIAGDHKPLINEIILESGICNDIIGLILNYNTNSSHDIYSSNIELQQHMMWTIRNVVWCNNNLQPFDLQNKFTNLLVIICQFLLESKDNEVLREILWTLNGLGKQSDEMLEYIANHCDCINLCVKILNSEFGKYAIAKRNKNNSIKDAILAMNDKIYIPCLRFIGIVLTNNDNLTQIVLDCGYLDCIEPFLNHFNANQRMKRMWALSNIFAGSRQQIECILSREQLMKSILNCAFNDILHVRMEAITCICNAVVDDKATPSQKKRFADYGAIEALCKVLNPINTLHDHQLILIAEALEAFLKTFGDGNINPFALQIEKCQAFHYLKTRSLDRDLADDTFQAIISLRTKLILAKNQIDTRVLD